MDRFDSLSISVRMTIVADNDNDATLGKGVVALLEGVRDLGSLNRAAKNLKMAYSKAWKIVKQAEDGFGFDLIDRDGARGSTLTPEGIELLSVYESIEAETQQYANKRFREEIARFK